MPAQLKKSVVKPPHRQTSAKKKGVDLDTTSPATSKQRPKPVQRKDQGKVNMQHKEVDNKERPSQRKSQHTGLCTSTNTSPTTLVRPPSAATTSNRQNGDGDGYVITPVVPGSATVT